MTVRWLAEAKDEYGTAVRVGRDGDELVAEWIGLARLVVGRDGQGARFTAEPDAAPADIAKIERGAVPLFVRHLEGKLGLHGSAVAYDGRAALFLGASGQGKSTLAAAMCSHAAAALVADDAVAIDHAGDRWLAVPLEREHWLDAPARGALGLLADVAAKTPSLAVARAEAPVDIALVAVLAFADVDRPRLVPLGAMEAIASLIPLVVRFVVDEPDVQRRELDLLADFVARVPTVRLERPRGFPHLAATAIAVADVLRHGAPRS